MSIEYRLRDADDNIFNLNTSDVTVQLKETTTQLDDAFQFENSIVPKSYLPGSVLVGANRLMQRVFTLTMERTNPVSATYRNELNALLSFVEKTVYIEDITNNMRLKVVIDLATILYGQGGLKHMSMDTFNFVALNPYWEDLTVDSYTGSIVANTVTPVSILNEGFLQSPPKIVLVAPSAVAVTSVQCSLESNNYSLQVDDALFGTASNLTMIIDCELGEVLVGSSAASENTYNRSIVDGTSFFNFQTGADSLYILCVGGPVNYTITFRKRYLV